MSRSYSQKEKGSSRAGRDTTGSQGANLAPPAFLLKADIESKEQNNNFSASGYSTAQQKPVIQAKKSGDFDYSDSKICRPNRLGVDFSVYSGTNGEEKSNKIDENITAAYDDNLERGTRYWAGLQEKIRKYNADDERDDLVQDLSTKRTSYNKRFKNNYSTKSPSKKDDSVVEINSWGKEKKTSNKKRGADYSNKFDFDNDKIEASHNYATTDKARIHDAANKDTPGYKAKGLPNSELIWQQYLLASKKRFKKNKEANAINKMKDLKKLSRVQVANAGTQKTAYKALPDSKPNWESAHTWNAGSEEFLALLGSPNCSGSAFMLGDHVDQLDGKTISSIELIPHDRDLNLDINFTT